MFNFFNIYYSLTFLATPKDDEKSKGYQCWCWITPSYKILTYIIYGVYWLFILLNIFITCKTTRFLKSTLLIDNNTNYSNSSKIAKYHHNYSSSEDNTKSQSFVISNNKKIRKVIVKLYIYPLVAFIIWSIATASRMFEIIYYDFYSIDSIPEGMKIIRIVLYSMQAIVMSGRGFIYTVLYFNRYEKIRAELKLMWKNIKKFFNCCNKRKYVCEGDP